MKEIQLTQGYKAQVSDKDYARVVAAGAWHAAVFYRKDGTIKVVYAVSSANKSMHRLVKSVNDPKVFVDHRNRNGLHNQRRNLRKATRMQNFHNASLSVKNRSGFKGVSLVKGTRKKPWRVDIAYNGKQHFLGYFAGAKEASKVHDRAAKRHHKTFAT